MSQAYRMIASISSAGGFKKSWTGMPAQCGVPWVFKWVDAMAQQVGCGEQQQDQGASEHLRSTMGKEPASLRVPTAQVGRLKSGGGGRAVNLRSRQRP